MPDRRELLRLDARDPLAHLRSRFALSPDRVYLDGNSLGPLPAHVPAILEEVVRKQWGTDLIASWNDHGWWELPRRVGERIAPLIGAPPGTVVVGDTTSVALYKAVSAARRLRPDRSVLLTDSGNFPTDLYVLSSVASQDHGRLEVVAPDGVEEALDVDVAAVTLTHVDYRTGRRHSLEGLTEAAHRVGALIVWDLSHSVGAMDLDMSEVDMAVGCGYKYLNGGPGAPAFLFVNRRHHRQFVNPIAGWWAHADPFAMEATFRPAEGIARGQIGTQPILSLVALDAALDVFDGIDTRMLRAKSEGLVATFLALVDERLEGGLRVVTPLQPSERGSQVSFAHPAAAGIMAALIARGVVGDVRPPDLLRFGLSPAFQRYLDLWEATEALCQVMETGEWKGDLHPTGPVT